MPDKEPDSTGSEPGPIPFLMRYAKLGAGVLLAVVGAVATVGAVGGWIAYVATCMGAPAGSLDADVCAHQNALVQSVIWTLAAILFVASAVVVIRSRSK
jgi:hypothetical protein